MLSVALICFSVAAKTARVAGPVSYTFALNQPATVSSGIFSAEGALVRTVSANEFLSAGTHKRVWDGKDDTGKPAPAGDYSVKAIKHNLQFRWAGTIGNTSVDRTGASKIRGIGGILDILHLKGYNYILRDYNEGYEWVTRFKSTEPGRFYPSGQRFTGSGRSDAAKYVAASFDTDGKYIYVGMTYNPFFNRTRGNNIILAFDPEDRSDGALKRFSGITPIPGVEAGQNDSGKFMVLNSPEALTVTVPNSLAVQRQGPVLAVAMRSADRVLFYNRVTGQISSTIPSLAVPQPSYIRWSADESRLFVSSTDPALPGIHVYRYSGGKWTREKTISVGAPVVGMAVNRESGTLAAMVGGDVQQVKFFSAQGGALKTLGSLGGYREATAVVPDRFGFIPLAKRLSLFSGGVRGLGGIAFEPGGGVWVTDKANSRIQQFLADGTAGRSAGFVPGQQYLMAVDANDPTRIFSGYTEYKRNYKIPLTPDSSGRNGAWKMVRNWGYMLMRDGSREGLVQGRAAAGSKDGISQVLTATRGPAAGRTFAILESSLRNKFEFVELDPEKGLILRDTFASRKLPNLPSFIADSGFDRPVSVFSLLEDEQGLKVMAQYGEKQFNIYEQHLVGFTDGRPDWSRPVIYASTPYNSVGYAGPSGLGGGIAVLSDGALVTANNTDVDSPGTPFIGILPVGATRTVNEFARGAYNQPLRRDGTVPIRYKSAHQGYPSGGVRTARDLIAQFNHGEFIYSAEMNQIALFHRSGLPLGQAGQRLATHLSWAATSGAGGNFNSHWMNALPSGDIVIHANSESMQGGVSEFLIKNVDSIRETTKPLGSAASLDLGVLDAPADSANSQVASAKSPGIINLFDPLTLPPMSLKFSDTFARPNSNSVGSGWVDSEGKFKISGGQLTARASNFYNSGSLSSILVPGNANVLSSLQTLRIPANFDDPNKLWTTSYAKSFQVGLVSRLQNGNQYSVEVDYNKDNGRPATLQLILYQVSNVAGLGSRKLAIAIDEWAPAPDFALNHSFTLSFAVTGKSPTLLQAVLRDDVTGKKVVLQAENDEPSLQVAGRVGILAKRGKNALAGDKKPQAYSLKY